MIQHRTYMEIAKKLAQESHAVNHKVGALIEKDGNIIGFGFNGMPSGLPNECEYWNEDLGRLKTKTEVIHAEMNAIAKCAKSGLSTNGATMYVSLSPCYDCCKNVIQSGIKALVYEEQYRDVGPLVLLKKCGVEVIKLEEK